MTSLVWQLMRLAPGASPWKPFKSGVQGLALAANRASCLSGEDMPDKALFLDVSSVSKVSIR